MSLMNCNFLRLCSPLRFAPKWHRGCYLHLLRTGGGVAHIRGYHLGGLYSHVGGRLTWLITAPLLQVSPVGPIKCDGSY